MKDLFEKLGITPGPWEWCIDKRRKAVHLFGGSLGYGKECVMDFVRSGMQGAKPRFQKNRLMTDSITMAIPRKGDEHNSDWRSDLDNTDARLIAAAPEMLEALIMVVESFGLEEDSLEGVAAIEAIEKAAGRKWEEIRGMM